MELLDLVHVYISYHNVIMLPEYLKYSKFSRYFFIYHLYRGWFLEMLIALVFVSCSCMRELRFIKMNYSLRMAH
jgi:hypothetical protein